MKEDFSLFLLKNSLASRMKKGFKSFCHGVGSTSTLDQGKTVDHISCIAAPSIAGCRSPLTLEEMILQLDMEEEAARRTKLDEYSELHRRMSCVNNSDILRSARNAAMHQYPRFSLDGRDAMYRSSFRNFNEDYRRYEPGRRSICCSSRCRGRRSFDCCEIDFERNMGLPPMLAGESVIWCKPGIVAKLMGLDAVPVPVSSRHGRTRRPYSVLNRKQNLRRIGRHELEKERHIMGFHASNYKVGRKNEGSGSSTMCRCSAVRPAGIERREEWRFARAR